jgi:glycosyltransferase involved in cell wall biosynthesis
VKSDIAIAFVGSVVPDRPRYHNAAFSRAINQWQENLIYGLRHAGLTDIEVFSAECVPRFPHSKRLVVWGGRDVLEGDVPVRLLPFLNLGVFKVITPGVAAFFRLLRWGVRKRRKRRLVLAINLMIPPCIPTLWAARLIGAKTMASANDIFVPGDLKPDTPLWRVNWWIHEHYLPKFDGLNVVNPHIVRDLAPRSRFIHVDTGVREEYLSLFEPSLSPPQGAAHVAPGSAHLRVAGPEDDPLPLRDDRFSALLQEKGGTFTIAFAGWLSEMNMISTILEAFAMLDDETYRLEIAGSGELEDVVQHAAQEDERITYHGYLPFDQVVALYRRADLLLNLVQSEYRTTRYSFPGKLAQLLATGKPVMTTYTEDLQDVTFLLREAHPAALADAIRSVRGTPHEALAQMGQRAREYVRQNKTWEVHGQTFRAFIESLFEP